MPPAYAIGANVDLPDVAVDNMIAENQVNVFPVPARDIINVELPDDFGNAQARISLHTMYGNLLQTTELSGATSTQLNVSKLPAGMYMVRIVSGTERIDKVISIVD